MTLLPVDAVSAVILFLVFFRGKESSREFAALEERGNRNDKFKEAEQANGLWNEASEAKYNAEFREIARGFFNPWISPRSFAAALCGAVVTLALGFNSLMGVCLGLCISSPRLQATLIRLFSPG